MAAFDYREGGGYGHDGGQHTARRPSAAKPSRFVSRWVNLAGALTSVVMITGLVVWGYRLAMRDVNGVPVIRALDTPGRIAPEDPGGELVRYRGLAVNAVAGSGAVAAPPARVTLAPTPRGLEQEDVPMRELVRQEKLSDGPEAPDGDTPVPAVATPAGLVESAAGGSDAAGQSTVSGADHATADAASDDSSEAIPASVPGVVISPRPLPRPRSDELLAAALKQAVNASMDRIQGKGKPVDIDPASLAAGTRLVQIGAFDTPGDAKSAWDRVAARFDALMQGKKRIIQKATSGGHDFYRLRVAGFEGVTEARQFCAALVAEGQSCIPTAPLAVVRE